MIFDFSISLFEVFRHQLELRSIGPQIIWSALNIPTKICVKPYPQSEPSCIKFEARDSMILVSYSEIPIVLHST